jgi:NADH dehydrogenase FAD-containing subunit
LEGAETGKRVVVFGQEGIEAAVSLAHDGKKVTFIQEGSEIDWPPYITGGGARREPLSRALVQRRVNALYNTSVKSVGKNTVTVETNGKEETIECDTVLFALGRERVNDLYLKYKGAGREVYVIGDAKEVRSMTPASHEGYWVGRTI